MNMLILQGSPRANENHSKNVSLKIIVTALLATMLCFSTAQAGENRRHKTPDGWSDNISAVLEQAKAENRNVLVFFPNYYDETRIGTRKLSIIKQWTNPPATEAMGKVFALAFYPFGYPVPSVWRKVHGFTKGTPQLLILDQDGDLLWAGYAIGFHDPDSNWGALWMKEKYPELEKILGRILPVRKRAATVASKSEKAKMMFDALKEFDPKIVQELFHDEVEAMVDADKEGGLGIKQHFPFWGYVMPVVKARLDFWNARESKINQILGKNKISRPEAAKIATRELQEEWEPKINKIVKAADKIEEMKGKSLNEQELGTLKWNRRFANEVLLFWSGDVQDAPGYEHFRK